MSKKRAKTKTQVTINQENWKEKISMLKEKFPIETNHEMKVKKIMQNNIH